MTIVNEDEQIFVLGLDGVPFDLIDLWTSQGKLENFAKISNEGVRGSLRSTVPATTPLAWPSITTGFWPDSHGCYGFYSLESDHGQTVNTSVDIQRSQLWDILSPAVVANVPMTYPVADVEGKLVAGMMSPEKDDGFTNTEQLRREIETRIPGYQIGLNWGDYHDRKNEFTDDISTLLKNRRELMKMLMETDDWRLFFFVYTAPDRLQHLIWDEQTLLEHYQELDDILGEVLDYVSHRNGTLFVVSDHGFGPISTFVNVNTILAKNGYLTAREGEGTRWIFDRLGIRKSRVLRAFDRIGITEQDLVEYLPKSIIDAAASRIPGEHGRYDVDYSQTTAFVHGPGNVYVNDTERFDNGRVDPSVRPEIRDDLIQLFSNVSNGMDSSVIDIHDGSKLFPKDSQAPDVVLEGKNGYKVTTELTDDVFTDSGTHAGDHRPDGIFLAWGPSIDSGSTVTDASVVDFAPTVFHAAGKPVPKDADGRVLSEIFRTGSSPDKRAIETEAYTRTARTDDSEGKGFDEVEDRLKGLGYIDQ